MQKMRSARHLPSFGRMMSGISEGSRGGSASPSPRSGCPSPRSDSPTSAAEAPSPLPPLPRPKMLADGRPRMPPNRPANLAAISAERGQLTLAEVRAAWSDAKFQCPLHKNKVAQCMLLTKHEVRLANKLWVFVQECTNVKVESVHGLLKLLGSDLAKDDSLIAQAQHRHIFKLSNAQANPLFAMSLRRMAGGSDVPFREFISALCPCASEARLEVYMHWQVGNWSDEQRFVKTIKSWRKDSREQPVMSARAFKDHQEEMRALDHDRDGVLSVKDLVLGGAMEASQAKELVEQHDLNGDRTLNLNEYMAMMCPAEERSMGGVGLEVMLKAKFEAALASWKSGRDGPPPAGAPGARQVEGISLDELVGHLDLKTAFGLMEVWRASCRQWPLLE